MAHEPTRELVLRDGHVLRWSARVVSLRGAPGQRVPAGAAYVGRRLHMGGWRLDATPWANPFSLRENTLADALSEFRASVARRSDDDLRAWLAPLRGQRLACWCHNLKKNGAPSAAATLCHGDVLAETMARLWPEDGV